MARCSSPFKLEKKRQQGQELAELRDKADPKTAMDVKAGQECDRD